MDVIICDSPLPISIVYDKENSEIFHQLIIEQFNKFNNFNFLLERSAEYQTEGRMQTEEEAKEIDNTVIEILNKYKINYEKLPIDDACQKIVEKTLNILKNE